MKKWIIAGIIFFPVALVLGFELASGRPPEIKGDDGHLLPGSITALEAAQGKELVVFDRSAHTPFMGEARKFNRELVRVKAKTYP